MGKRGDLIDFIYGEISYGTVEGMHDAIVHDWIGCGGEPDLASVEEVSANLDASADEIEREWDLSMEGYDRDEFKAAVERLRDDLRAEEDA